ncbi:MAG: hypothetical protein ACOC1X_04095, partial [Promethearchaeota archaeon]
MKKKQRKLEDINNFQDFDQYLNSVIKIHESIFNKVLENVPDQYLDESKLVIDKILNVIKTGYLALKDDELIRQNFRKITEIHYDVQDIKQKFEIFTIRDGISKKLHEELMKIDNEIAHTYFGALETLDKVEQKEKFHQVANSFKRICEVIYDLKEAELPTTDIHDALKSLCERFQELANYEKTIREQHFDRHKRDFENILYDVLRPSLEVLEELDKMLRVNTPSDQDIRDLKRILVKLTYKQYFFTKLSK